MSQPFRHPEYYEMFIYTLTERFSEVNISTLTFVRRNNTVAKVTGSLFFDKELRLDMRELLEFDSLPLQIVWYGYEVWHGKEKLYWYDPQPHPNTPSLQSTHPHHKHIPPNIKRNRIPAPNLRFDQPNLPFLIDEIGELLAKI